MAYVRVREVEELVGHHFSDPSLIEAALTHPSAVEGQPRSASYERLEFLGDSILGAMVAHDLFVRYPALAEGDLTRMKIALVSGGTLSEVAEGLGLADHIRFGASEYGTHARGLRHALENVYEAVVGALYLDAGADEARRFVRRTLGPYLERGLSAAPVNPKSRLQEVTQAEPRGTPTYEVVSTDGPAHLPTFTAVAKLGGVRVGRGSGTSKKEAEAAAAQDALERLERGTGA